MHLHKQKHKWTLQSLHPGALFSSLHYLQHFPPNVHLLWLHPLLCHITMWGFADLDGPWTRGTTLTSQQTHQHFLPGLGWSSLVNSWPSPELTEFRPRDIARCCYYLATTPKRCFFHPTNPHSFLFDQYSILGLRDSSSSARSTCSIKHSLTTFSPEKLSPLFPVTIVCLFFASFYMELLLLRFSNWWCYWCS